jgi:hypothetical protein
MLNGGVGLIAVPRAQLLKDGCTDLLEANLKDLCLDGLNDQCIIDLDVVEIEIGGTQHDRPIVQAGLEDIGAYLRRTESAEVIGAKPCDTFIIMTMAVDHNPSHLG